MRTLSEVMSFDLTELSKTISHALRHAPWFYDLDLDDQGWVDLSIFVAALRKERLEWAELTPDDISRLVAGAEKHRHEIRQGRIRALYGHSLPGKLTLKRVSPPSIMFHGTAPKSISSIMAGGLLPMGRQFVHLGMDRESALRVGRRKAANPVIILVRAAEAAADSVQFYEGNETIILADSIPPQYLSIEQRR